MSGLGFSGGDDFGEGDGFAAAAFAFVGGFHEGEEFEGFSGVDGRFGGLEEFDDFCDEWGVAVEGTDGCFAGGAGGFAAVGGAFAEDAGAAAGPRAADLDFAVGRGGAGDGLAAGAHDGEEGFAAVDPVPEEVGVVGFEWGWASGFGVEDLADAAVADGLGGFGEAEGRGREDGNACGFG